ncbi:MAG: sulfite exporter TauE/SafE family protein [Pseudomonadota bacterium]
MTVLDVPFLVGVGLIGGVWNAVAGGATLFTFPALMWIGLPPVVANATNYVAMLPSNAAALPAYRDELSALAPALPPLIIVTCLGALVGSLALIWVDPELFLNLVPGLICLATVLFACGERVRAWLVGSAGDKRSYLIVLGALYVASIYGGFFGAGLGIILLAIAQIVGFSAFHSANAVKNLLATCFTVISIIVFGVGGLVAWPEAATMMVGSSVGGYLGGRLSHRVNDRLLRGAVIVFGAVLTLVYAVRQFVL